MAEAVEIDPTALVIRFRPTQAESVLHSALKEFRRADHYGCSVFAAVPELGESEPELITRLLASADLDGMTSDRHPKFYVCTEAGRLLEEGFVFMKDGGEDELRDHYCVSLGDAEPDEATVLRFLAPFDRTEKRES